MTWYLDTPSNDSRYSRPKRPAHSLIGRQNQQFLQSTSESAFGPWNFWQCPEWPALGGMLYTLETCAAMLSLHATMGRFQYVPITLLFWTWIPQVRIRRCIMQTNYAQRNFRQVGRRSVLLLWRLVFTLPYWRICRFTVYRIISQIYYRHRKTTTQPCTWSFINLHHEHQWTWHLMKFRAMAYRNPFTSSNESLALIIYTTCRDVVLPNEPTEKNPLAFHYTGWLIRDPSIVPT